MAAEDRNPSGRPLTKGGNSFCQTIEGRIGDATGFEELDEELTQGGAFVREDQVLALFDAELASAYQKNGEVSHGVGIEGALEGEALFPSGAVVHVAAKHDGGVVEETAFAEGRGLHRFDKARELLHRLEVAGGHHVEVALHAAVMGV